MLDTMIPTVTMHSRADCPYCDTARAFLTANAIPFTEIKHDDLADRQAMYDALGLVGAARTVPQVIVTDAGEDYLIGGAKALVLSGIGSLFGITRALDVPDVQDDAPQTHAIGAVVAVGDSAGGEVCEACQ